MTLRFVRPVVVVALVFVAFAVAWCVQFVQDDAFISFRYARNLADGIGLVYNEGERVEGFTNFLWTLCMAVSFWLGVDVVVWSKLLSFASFAGVLVLTMRVATRWFGERAGLVALALVSLNYSFCAYATGGLETMFSVFLILASVDLLATERHLAAAVATAMSILTRMDTSLVLLPFWVAAVLPDKSGWRLRIRHRALLAGVSVIVPVLLAFFLFRHSYYGAWLPNTALIKGRVSLIRGVAYVGLFHAIYGYGMVAWFFLSRRLWAGMKWSLPAAIAVWHAYIVLVGGDFMEFRLFLTCFPLLAIMTARLVLMLGLTRRKLATGLFSLLLLLAAVGVVRFLPARLFQTVPDLKSYYAELMELVPEFERIVDCRASRVKIGITSAGILPYYLNLPTLDLLGLNDRDVALHGLAIPPAHPWLGNRPGHCRMASWQMVRAKNVNLLINYAWTADRRPDIRSVEDLNRAWPFFHVPIPRSEPVALILWPISGGRVWPMVYVTPHPAVDAAIRRLGAEVLRFNGIAWPPG